MFKIIPNEQTPKTQLSVDFKNDAKLLKDFLLFAKRLSNCAGLASNQVSFEENRINKSFFAVCTTKGWYLVLNPKITKYKGLASIQVEGCKTWSNKTIIAERYPSIEVEYTNSKGDLVEREIKGFEAQVFQHEYSHIQGVAEKVIGKAESFFEKINRNEPCLCGSGLKYKKCCGSK